MIRLLQSVSAHRRAESFEQATADDHRITPGTEIDIDVLGYHGRSHIFRSPAASRQQFILQAAGTAELRRRHGPAPAGKWVCLPRRSGSRSRKRHGSAYAPVDTATPITPTLRVSP